MTEDLQEYLRRHESQTKHELVAAQQEHVGVEKGILVPTIVFE